VIVESGPRLVFVKFNKIIDSLSIFHGGEFIDGTFSISDRISKSKVLNEFCFEEGPIFKYQRNNSCIVGFTNEQSKVGGTSEETEA